jgi:hypothetical protein
LGTELPSVKTPVCGPPVYFASTCSRVRFSSREDDLRPPLRLREAFFGFFFGECSRQYFGVQPANLSIADCGTENEEPHTWHEKVGIAQTVRRATT